MEKLEQLHQRLADTELFLAVEEAADRCADLEKIGRLRAARADLLLQIRQHEDVSPYLRRELRTEAAARHRQAAALLQDGAR